MRPDRTSWHYRLFETTYYFFYGIGGAPKEPTLSLYLWRLPAVLPFQFLLFLILLAMIAIMTVASSAVLVPLGIGIFYVEGFIPFKFSVRRRVIEVWQIVIPLYALAASVYFGGVYALWCIALVALCVGTIWASRSKWAKNLLDMLRIA